MKDTELKPCPFCGERLNDYPKCMVFQKATSDDYIRWLKETGQLIGSDNYFTVVCPSCGSIGKRGLTKDAAVKAWNRRADK